MTFGRDERITPSERRLFGVAAGSAGSVLAGPTVASPMRRTIVVAVFALLVGVGWSAVAGAASIDDVATALRSDPVYVDPAAERALSESESGRGP